MRIRTTLLITKAFNPEDEVKLVIEDYMSLSSGV